MSPKPYLLYKSCVSNDIDGVRKALKKSFFSSATDVNHRIPIVGENEEGNYPIHLAAKNGNTAIVKLLIEAGANVFIYNNLNENPFQLAARSGNVELGDLLLSNGIDMYEHKGLSSEPIFIALENENIAFANYLLEKGLQLERGFLGMRNWMIDNNKPNSLKWLLEKGKALGHKPDDLDLNGKTMLLNAIDHDFREVAEVLIEMGTDVNKADKSGNSPFISAARKGNLAMLRLLSEHGANPDQSSDGGENALSIAIKNNHLEIVEFLLSKDVKNVSWYLWDINMWDGVSMMQLLVKNGADIDFQSNSRYHEYRTLLKRAIDEKNIKLACALVDMGAKLQYTSAGKMRYLFTEAVKLGNMELIHKMLGHGADINENNSSAMLQAVGAKNKELVQFLFEHGAQPNEETKAEYEKYKSDEKAALALKDVKDDELYELLLGSNGNDFKLAVLERYEKAFPDQFDLEKCKGGKDIIMALINLKVQDNVQSTGSKLSDNMTSYGKLIPSAYLIQSKSDAYSIVVGHSSSSGDYETTISRTGHDVFNSEELMTSWN